MQYNRASCHDGSISNSDAIQEYGAVSYPTITTDVSRLPVLTAAVYHQNPRLVEDMIAANHRHRTRQHGIVAYRNIAVEVTISAHIHTFAKTHPARINEQRLIQAAVAANMPKAIQKSGL
jgi:stress response protein YsnF